MTDLADLQQRFQSHLLCGAEAPLSGVQGHMAIYTNAYRGRLREALADNYPVLYRALGDDAFRELAGAYLEAHPSHFRSIRWFGDQLVDFIAAGPGVVPHPALLDVARLDWAMRGAFDAADATPLSFDDLAGIAPERWPELRFRLCPSFRLLALDWGIEALWHALNEDENAQTAEPQPNAHAMIVWRAGLELRWRTLAGEEAAALSALQAGADFAAVCAAAEEAGGCDAVSVAGLLGQWIGEGLLMRP
jgi:hypothetical protein